MLVKSVLAICFRYLPWTYYWTAGDYPSVVRSLQQHMSYSSLSTLHVAIP
jgi:hypothetical protein